MPTIPDPPRYELRPLPEPLRRGTADRGLWDTFTQQFVEGEGPFSFRLGLAAVRRYNGSYAEDL